ncbi:hypothetical protein LXT21_41620 [Myxococcus sp. K38C18041901]|uniref:hypothetical protein n=1 Tax=Myxococcus guangdongensis TaxID=2906760 RepID=UPI0020A6E9E9|nr:hypothetical protein [Myxococcus guangdongensis]MCP3065291.1 hypothetical protein [Myxococcus guangdongensis]
MNRCRRTRKPSHQPCVAAGPYNAGNGAVVAHVARAYVTEQQRLGNPNAQAMSKAVAGLEASSGVLPEGTVIAQAVWDDVYARVGETFAAVERQWAPKGGDA